MIYLVRHGDTVPEERDPTRPLSEKGRAEVEATARALLKEKANIEEIWHSTKLRAKQTAEIIAQILGIKNVLEKEGLTPFDDPAPVAELLKAADKNILIAGHMPFLGELALLFGKSVMGFENGGVVVLMPNS
jgi:phosphohistidine phosphatase